MYNIKHVPEDFVVKEVSNVKAGKKGRYTYFLLKKRDYTTEKAIQAVASYLHIDRRRFGYAGSKDRRAVTEQLCSVLGSARNIKIRDLETAAVGCSDTPISLGDLEGNWFEITARNLSGDDLALLKKNYEKLKKGGFRITNFFDEQRFSKNNAEIGKAIAKGSFKDAVSLVLESAGGYEEAMRLYLKEKPNDFIGALRIIPKKVLQLYIHAFQSSMWNKAAMQLRHSKKNISLPLVGFGTEFEDRKTESVFSSLMKEEGITQRDFIIRKIPELSSEGSERSLFAWIKDLKVSEPEKDDLNRGKRKIRLGFFLQKGAYATAVVKELFRPPPS